MSQHLGRRTLHPYTMRQYVQMTRYEIKDGQIWVSIDGMVDKEGKLVGNIGLVIRLLSE